MQLIRVWHLHAFVVAFLFLKDHHPYFNEDKTMKKLALACASLLLFLSTAVFAEEHAYTAIEHASAAIAQGKADKAPALVQHATQALEHAKMAENVAQGHSKTQMQSAVKALQKAIDQGNAGDAKSATQSTEEAVGFLQAGNK